MLYQDILNKMATNGIIYFVIQSECRQANSENAIAGIESAIGD
jgi:hypothetical protein